MSFCRLLAAAARGRRGRGDAEVKPQLAADGGIGDGQPTGRDFALVIGMPMNNRASHNAPVYTCGVFYSVQNVAAVPAQVALEDFERSAPHTRR